MAESAVEREDAFKLRYEIFVEELGYNILPNEERKLIDQFDDTSHIIVAYDDGRLVGSLRSNGAYEGKLPFEDESEIKTRFKLAYPMVSTTSKIAIRKEYRSSILAYKLVSHIYQLGLEHNVLCDFITVQKDELFDFYERLGYRKYMEPFDSAECGIVTPMVLDLRDQEYLTSIKSPFIRMLRKHEGEMRVPKTAV